MTTADTAQMHLLGRRVATEGLGAFILFACVIDSGIMAARLWGWNDAIAMRPLIFASMLLLAACDDTPGKWSLYVYPYAHDRSNWQRTDRFKSEGMCRRAGEESIAALREPAKAAFRCVESGGPS